MQLHVESHENDTPPEMTMPSLELDVPGRTATAVAAWHDRGTGETGVPAGTSSEGLGRIVYQGSSAFMWSCDEEVGGCVRLKRMKCDEELNPPFGCDTRPPNTISTSFESSTAERNSRGSIVRFSSVGPGDPASPYTPLYRSSRRYHRFERVPLAGSLSGRPTCGCKEEDAGYEPDQPYLSQPGLIIPPSRTVPRDGDLVIEDFPLVHEGYTYRHGKSERAGLPPLFLLEPVVSPLSCRRADQMRRRCYSMCARLLTSGSVGACQSRT